VLCVDAEQPPQDAAYSSSGQSNFDDFTPLIRRRTFNGEYSSVVRAVSSPTLSGDATRERASRRPPVHSPQRSVSAAGSAHLAAGGTTPLDIQSSADGDDGSSAGVVAPPYYSGSPGSAAAHKDRFVMKLHRKSMMEDLVTSVAHLLERRVVGSGGNSTRAVQEATRTMLRAHFHSLPQRYALSVEPADVLVHVKLMEDARRTGRLQAHLCFTSSSSSDTATADDSEQRQPAVMASVVIACRDCAALLDAITRALRRISKRIADADVMTSSAGIALDRFEVQLLPQHSNLNERTLAKLIEAALMWHGSADDADAGDDTHTAADSSSTGATAATATAAATAAGSANGHSTVDFERRRLVRRSSDAGGHTGASTAASAGASDAASWLRASEEALQSHYDSRSERYSSSANGSGAPLQQTHTVNLVSSSSGSSSSSSSSSGGFGLGNALSHHAQQQQHHSSNSTGSNSSSADVLLPENMIPYAELTLLEPVGHGRFSSTHRALWRGQVVAVKCVELPDPALPARSGDSAAAREAAAQRATILSEFERELTVVRSLRHPYIAAFRGASVHDNLRCLVFEFMECGTLADWLRRPQPPAAAAAAATAASSSGNSGAGAGAATTAAVTEAMQLLRIALEVAEAMRYLHGRGVLHRDLKSTNVLLDKDKRYVVFTYTYL
jgi:Protein tyrosine and serine/threonine kinase